MEAKDRIIVALDVPSVDSAVELVKQLAPHVGGFKLGLQFQRVLLNELVDLAHDAFRQEGANHAIVDARMMKVQQLFANLDGKLILDGKDHDIPNTMAGAAGENVKLKVLAFTVHAAAGPGGLRAAVENRGNALVLAVTVLTSHDERTCRSIFGNGVEQKVGEFARMAARAGVQGIVCSPADLPKLKSKPLLPNVTSLEGLEFWTPGVRPRWSRSNDQTRITTPAEAIKAGATRLIIGRPITNPPEEIGNPVEAIRLITEETESAI